MTEGGNVCWKQATGYTVQPVLSTVPLTCFCPWAVIIHWLPLLQDFDGWVTTNIKTTWYSRGCRSIYFGNRDGRIIFFQRFGDLFIFRSKLFAVPTPEKKITDARGEKPHWDFELCFLIFGAGWWPPEHGQRLFYFRMVPGWVLQPRLSLLLLYEVTEIKHGNGTKQNLQLTAGRHRLWKGVYFKCLFCNRTCGFFSRSLQHFIINLYI